MSRPELWVPGSTITPAMWETRVTPIARTAVQLIRAARFGSERSIVEDAAALLDFLPAHTVASRLQDGSMPLGWDTLDRVATVLAVPYQTLHRWAVQGHGPGRIPVRARRHGRTWVVSLDDAAAARSRHE